MKVIRLPGAGNAKVTELSRRDSAWPRETVQRPPTRCVVRLCVHYEAPTGWFVSDDGDFARVRFLSHRFATIVSKRMGKKERIYDFDMAETTATNLGFDRCA